MFRILESQAPAKQNATDTINILSGRLHSATLVEDRRAAILGLRSFAKLYPASVASGALRNLINSLSKDGEDVETAKVILETLLMLFNPDESSPEASDDIALWLADEFTQHQENITVLLDLLDRSDFFSRLYSLRLISAISTARLERTQECVYVAPLGVSRLVAILDDKREAVRTEGLLLLTALTLSSPDLQKLVAFENAFDRTFDIIESEGSLTHGGVIVQDCLSLLANLLRLNPSNQSFFRETGWMARLAGIIQKVIQEQDSPIPVSEWATAQRNKNLWGLLSVVRLFLYGGGAGTNVNQSSFWQNGVGFQVLEVAFHPSMDLDVRSEALITCADLIRGNGNFQERFAQHEVISASANTKTNGHGQGKSPLRVNVIQALLDLALSAFTTYAFEIRMSACECIKAYIFGHALIRNHFLRRARDGYLSNDEEIDNILTILLEEPGNPHSADPYRQWIAAVLLLHLIYEDYDAKHLAMVITEGDATQGEEVVTCIQSLSGNLISGAQRGNDDRIIVGYLMVLSCWLFEDPDAVNDFLGEGSNVQSLIQMVIQPKQQKAPVAGLCAFLLGIIYEFSTKDSPIPRAALHEILTNRLGREQFIDKMTKLREHPLIRDFEVISQNPPTDYVGSFPEVYFDRTFVDFLKDNFSRMLRAIDRDPGIEISVITNGIQKGISREMVDYLRAQVEDRTQALQRAESDILTIERKLSQEQADHRKAKEMSLIELTRIKNVNQNLQKIHEEECQKLQKVAQQSRLELERNYESMIAGIRAEGHKFKEDSGIIATKALSRHKEEVEDLKSTIHRLEVSLDKSTKDHLQDLQTANEDYSANIRALESRLRRAEDKAEEIELRANKALEKLDEKETARAVVQAELDDLFMVLGDLEEKRERDKKRLKSLGEQVSDFDDDEPVAADKETVEDDRVE